MSLGSKPVFTKISLPASITKVGTSDDLREMKGKRVLWIDLKRVVKQSLRGDWTTWNSEPSPKAEILLVENITNFVRQDMQANALERVDSVRVDAEYEDEPTLEMWQALDGLSPKHLEVRGGLDEACEILTLNSLHHQWKDLESLSLHGLGPKESLELPRIFSQVSTLELVFCHSHYFIPPGGVVRLKHLKIIENNAFDMFITACDRNRHFRKTLETLVIESTHSSCEFRGSFGPEDVRNRIKQCVNLRNLRFSIGDNKDSILDNVSYDLASHIPPSLEVLELQFTRSLPVLRDIDDWISHASDVNWLPRLKSFCISVKKVPREISPKSIDLELEKKRGVLYDLLKSARPSIHLIFLNSCSFT